MNCLYFDYDIIFCLQQRNRWVSKHLRTELGTLIGLRQISVVAIYVISKHMLWIEFMNTFCEIALGLMT